ncbi:hypothetical protein AVEN_88996-1 [Araneus ventricosus]|uniref:Uncharacterized protein n=1 Tax=Araneus ventricosus TaxID=182803 RepID=A0A4Y2DIS6_ARAVE|nr:hypothetical protein AVEN_88996-1 [Araneus ventricosus]
MLAHSRQLYSTRALSEKERECSSQFVSSPLRLARNLFVSPRHLGSQCHSHFPDSFRMPSCRARSSPKRHTARSGVPRVSGARVIT